MFVKGASRLDVKQGMLDDAWLLAAMAALSQDHILFTQVVPPNQDWDKRCETLNYDVDKVMYIHMLLWVLMQAIIMSYKKLTSE